MDWMETVFQTVWTTICTWTWMCIGNNIHPNEYGYQVIADAFAARLPPLIPVQAIHHTSMPQHR
jgi:lysophospholipase L1-like esterase